MARANHREYGICQFSHFIKDNLGKSLFTVAKKEIILSLMLNSKCKICEMLCWIPHHPKNPSPSVITQKAPRRRHLKQEARKDTLGTQPPVNKQLIEQSRPYQHNKVTKGVFLLRSQWPIVVGRAKGWMPPTPPITKIAVGMTLFCRRNYAESGSYCRPKKFRSTHSCDPAFSPIPIDFSRRIYSPL